MNSSIATSVRLALGLAFAATAWSVQADVRTGVDAWQGGDYATAIAEWQPLAQAGDADAQFNLGQAYKLGRGVPQDLDRAEQLFGQASAQGHLQAEANYGLIKFQRGDREAAMPYIMRAANRGEPRAQYIYGTALFNGDLAPRDWPRAYAMMTRASAAGIPQAAASLQQLDEYIPLDQREAGTRMAAQIAAQTEEIELTTAAPPPTSAPTPGPNSAPTPRAVEPRVASSSPPSLPPAPQAVAQADIPPPAPTPRTAPPRTQAPAPRTTQAPPPAPQTAVAATGDWRIQLGSFSERTRAERHWRAMSARVAELSALQPYLVSAGPYTRLQAGPFRTEADASRACAAARRGGSDCITAHRQ